MNKKGISPLIATVLLIGFTVALVLVVTTWGTGYIKEMLGSTEKSTNLALMCSPPYLDFDTQFDCSGKLTIMNRGTEDIVKLKVIPYADGVVKEAKEITKEIVVAGAISESVPSATKYEVVAFILHNGEETPCAQAMREVTVDC